MAEPGMGQRHVVLVRVPEDFNTGLQEISTPYECLGLGCVAAALRRSHHRVTIVDGTLMDPASGAGLEPTFKQLLADLVTGQGPGASRTRPDSERLAWLVRLVWIAQQVVNLRPDVVGFSLVSSLVYARVAELVGLLRSLGLDAVCCAGGEQATLYAADVLRRIPGLDACVLVEGEETLVELLEHLDNRDSWTSVRGLAWRSRGDVVVNAPRPLLQDLDAVPPAARDTLPDVLARGGDALLYASRGCAYSCTFCSIIEFYDASPRERWRSRSVAGVVAEIERLYREHGADRFWIVDDIFFGISEAGRTRGHEFFTALVDSRLPVRFDIFCRANDLIDQSSRRQTSLDLQLAVRAGLRRALVGVESGSDRVLRQHFRKGATAAVNAEGIARAERAGVDVAVEFIMFDPWTTIADIEQSVALLRSVPIGQDGHLGKHDPQVLSSRLYLHRETPLGREFVSTWAHLVDQAQPDTGLDYLVPYRFESPAVGALHQILDRSWTSFAPVLRALEQLFRIGDRFWVPSWSEGAAADELRGRFRDHNQRRLGLQRLLNEEALELFEEALGVVAPFACSTATPERLGDELADVADAEALRMSVAARNVGSFVYSLAVEALEEAWNEASARGLLGRWTRPPSVLVDELGAAIEP